MKGGIQVSVIAPSRHLADFAAQTPPTIHYLAAQHVIRDASYRRFYLEQAERGAYLILDNGVFDLGHSLLVEDLVRAARLVNANEIMLPDVIHNGRETIRSSDRAARAMHRFTDTFHLCAVIQGATDSDWLQCYDHFMKAPYIAGMALPSPKRRSPARSIAFDRLLATEHLEVHGLIASQLVYRLLGLSDSGHLELGQQRRHPWIQSVDSSAPVVLGALGLMIRPGKPYTKPSRAVEELSLVGSTRYPIICANIENLRAAAGCRIRLPAQSEYA